MSVKRGRRKMKNKLYEMFAKHMEKYEMIAASIIAKAKRREQFVANLYYAVCEQIYDMAKKKEEDYEDSIQAMFDKNKKMIVN